MTTDVLLIGRAGSQGLPGKNWKRLLGRPLCEYAIIAAHNAKTKFNNYYVYTDSNKIGTLAKEGYGWEWLQTEETGKETLTEDALINAFKLITLDHMPDHIILLYSNSPVIQPGMIDEMLKYAQANPKLDSVVSVANYEMFEPLRAHDLDDSAEHYLDLTPSWGYCTGCVTRYLNQGGNSLRGSGGGTWFNDFAVQILSKKCFNSMWTGRLPFRWQGIDVAGYPNISGSFDLDHEWQIPVLEWSLKQIGFTEYSTPYSNG